LGHHGAELFTNFAQPLGSGSFFLHGTMELAVFALGIAGMSDFKRNTKWPFGEIVYQTAFG